MVDRIPSTIPVMPVKAAPSPAGEIFTAGTTAILLAMLLWWFFSAERQRAGWAMPFIFIGTALSSILIEPIFDNTLLYWYPEVNSLAVFRGFDRTIPWFVPLGYAWFFGGTAYFLARAFEKGMEPARFWTLFAFVVFIDWLAVSICEWLALSAFYGNQPYHLVGSPLWFSFCDATGAFMLAGALHLLLPHLERGRQPWLIVLPIFTYGATLGSTGAPVSIALTSGGSGLVVWAGGTASILMCLVVVRLVGFIARHPRGTLKFSGV